MSLSGDVHAILERMRAGDPNDDYEPDDVAELMEAADALANLFDD